MKDIVKQYKNLIRLVIAALLVLILVCNLHIIPTGFTGV